MPFLSNPPLSILARLTYGRGTISQTPQAECGFAFAPAPPVSTLKMRSARMRLGLTLYLSTCLLKASTFRGSRGVTTSSSGGWCYLYVYSMSHRVISYHAVGGRKPKPKSRQERRVIGSTKEGGCLGFGVWAWTYVAAKSRLDPQGFYVVFPLQYHVMSCNVAWCPWW